MFRALPTAFLFSLLTSVVLATVCSSQTEQETRTKASDFFEIQVIDSETNRGVPMVQLATVDGTTWITDSAGRIAFNEPGLMDKRVFFHVKSHGYQFPADGFGNRGFAVDIRPDDSKTIKIDRINIAERLYRITGRGIYRDSNMLGKRVPIAQPLLNGDVVGQDTVQTAIYKDRLFWFWGDTNRPQYPLGQFKTSGATSKLPSQTDLDVSDGINLNYFVDAKGFSRKMAPVEGKGAVWLHGLTVLRSDNGQETMFGHYVRLLALGKEEEHGLIRFNDKTQTFEKWVEFDKDVKLYPRGVSLYNENETGDYIYFCRPFPSVRVSANLSAITDPTQYESYTCLMPGARFQKGVDNIERDENQNPIWGWKKDTDVLDPERLYQTITDGFLKQWEARLLIRDESTSDPVYLKGGSVHWNKFRQRWVMIGLQIGGKASFLGEVWYAESDNLEGPWLNPRHVVTHDKYSFYNPSHHAFFDQEGGRLIYFEGTMATTFSQTKTKVPRYDYNQIMYRLDLGGRRMRLPPTNSNDSDDGQGH